MNIFHDATALTNSNDASHGVNEQIGNWKNLKSLTQFASWESGVQTMY